MCFPLRLSGDLCRLHCWQSRLLQQVSGVSRIRRGEFFRHIGSPFLFLQEQDVVFPVLECRLRYKAPARYDEQLSIALWVTKLEGVRLNFAYSIARQDGLLILEAETWHACTTVEGKPRKLPDSLCEKLRESRSSDFAAGKP